MLNPVEGCVADIKRAIQTEFATTLRAPSLNMAALEYRTRTQEREQIMLQAVTRALHVITPQLVQAHQNHMLAPFPRTLAAQDG
jgi:hypothetical protein